MVSHNIVFPAPLLRLIICLRDSDDFLWERLGMSGQCPQNVCPPIGGDWGLWYQPGSGGMQGDSPMPQISCATYNPCLQDWIDWKTQLLKSNIIGRDPYTGILVDVTTTSFADDVAETNIAPSGTPRTGGTSLTRSPDTCVEQSQTLHPRSTRDKPAAGNLRLRCHSSSSWRYRIARIATCAGHISCDS